ncbi:tyrosine-type recombinase/integrase [Listeria aquatica]|uniref:tyrosine-type recombinase/integrase n=1 Tax=Listeria aquatica TaxID=1494960 RepID=UPI003EF2085C
MELNEFLNEHLINLKILARAEGTIYNHNYYLTRLLDLLNREFGVHKLEEVKSSHIKSYIIDAQEKGLESNLTINKALAIFKVFFNYAVDEGFIDEMANPTRRIKNLKVAKTVIKSFSDKEVSAMINSVKGSTYSNIRDKLILMLLFDCGFRVSELVSLKNEDVRSTNILVRGKGSKERVLYISPLVNKQILLYKRARSKRFEHRLGRLIQDYYYLVRPLK